MDKAVKTFICLCAICMLCLGTHTTAHAYTITDSAVDSSALDCFRGILSGCNFFDDYVVFYSDNAYIMVVGEIVNENKYFLWENATEYVLSSSDSGYVYDVYYSVSGSVDTSNYIVYSNLGNYPLLEERGGIYEMFTFFTLCSCVVALLVRPIFKFTLRSR